MNNLDFLLRKTFSSRENKLNKTPKERRENSYQTANKFTCFFKPDIGSVF